MGQILDADWSTKNLLRSDWLLPSVASFTTHRTKIQQRQKSSRKTQIHISDSLNAKLCYCTQVDPCITLILTEIKGINDIIVLLVVGVT